MSKATPSIDRLLALQALVRDLRRGEAPCPWLSAQTPQSIAPYTLQESYELVETVMHGNVQGMKEELGDMLYHLLIYLDMLNEQADVTADEVIALVHAKLVRRRAPSAKTQAEAKAYWEAAKKHEALNKARRAPVDLAGLPDNMPALSDAAQLATRLQSQGVDMSGSADRCRALLMRMQQADEGTLKNQTEQAGALLFHAATWLTQQGVLPEWALRDFNGVCRSAAMSGLDEQALRALLYSDA